MSRFDDKPHHVYVFAAEDGHVLYVGCTASLLVRLRTHAASQSWWPRVRHVEWSVQPDKAAGLAEEERLTYLLKPEFAACLQDVSPSEKAQATRRARQERAHARGVHCTWSNCRHCEAMGYPRPKADLLSTA